MKTMLFILCLVILGTRIRGQDEGATDPVTLAKKTEEAVASARALPDVDTILVATVERVVASPGIWCGILDTRQTVAWRVDQQLLGPTRPITFEIRHHLVAGSSLVDRESPYLRPDLIYPGAKAVLALRPGGPEAEPRDDLSRIFLLLPPRTVPADHASLFRQALRAPELRAYAADRPAARDSLITVEFTEVLPVPFPWPDQDIEVRFLPRELVEKGRVWRFTGLTAGDTKAEVTLEIPAEGVRAVCHFEGGPGQWRLARTAAVER